MDSTRAKRGGELFHPFNNYGNQSSISSARLSVDLPQESTTSKDEKAFIFVSVGAQLSILILLFVKIIPSSKIHKIEN